MRCIAANAGKTIRLRIQVIGLDAKCRMIASGLGIGLIPDSADQLPGRVGELDAISQFSACPQLPRHNHRYRCPAPPMPC